MRVLHITPYFAPAFQFGGPPRSILGLCQGLRRSGVDVEVITIAHDQATASLAGAQSTYEGVPVRYLPPAFPRRFFGARFGAVLSDTLSRVDLCHVQGIWNVPEWSATRQARAQRVPYVVSPRGMLLPAAFRQGQWRKRVAFRVLESRNLRKAALLHATSPEEAKSLASFARNVPVAVVPNGVDAEAAAGASTDYRRRLAIPDDAVVIAFLGRFHPIKRLDLLAAAFATLRARNRDVHLVLAGPDERSLVPGLREMLAAHLDRVHFVGALDDTNKWAMLKAADVGVQCSDSESFGMSIVEFLSSGTPVVVTRTCPWQEIESAGCGLWVEQSAAAIAAALDALIADAARRHDMGHRAGVFAAERYSWTAVGRQMADCYSRILSGRTVPATVRHAASQAS